jgi:hypothetical protein
MINFEIYLDIKLGPLKAAEQLHGWLLARQGDGWLSREMDG